MDKVNLYEMVKFLLTCFHSSEIYEKDSELQDNLLYDMLTALNGAILGLKLEGHPIAPAKLSCSKQRVWQTGFKIVERMRKSRFMGRSGNVFLEENSGMRKNVSFEIFDLTKKGLVTTAVWSQHSGYLKSHGKN